MNDWKEFQLKDLVIKITKGTTPTTMGYKFKDSGINFIKAESIKQQGYIDDTTFAHIDDKTHAALKRSQIEEKDVLLTIAGIYLGKVGLVEKRHLPANTNQAVAIVRPDKAKIFPEFLKHFFFNKSTTTYLNILCPQSAQPNLNLTQLGCLKFHTPPLPIQKKIAAILSAYDDLIENNRRRIALLEKMAEETYREWFVRMRFPGREKVKMVKGVPEGWAIKNLCEVATIVDCLHTKKPDHNESGDGWLLQLDNIGDNGHFNNSTRYLISKSDYEKWSKNIEVVEGDCLITNVGRIAAIAQIPRGVRAALGRNMTAVRPTLIPSTFLIQFLLSPHMKEEVVLKQDHGAIMGALNVRAINKIRITIPSSNCLKLFDSQVSPIRKLIWNLSDSVDNLKKNRDDLLPRLLSGKLSVENLDIQFPPSMRDETTSHIGKLPAVLAHA